MYREGYRNSISFLPEKVHVVSEQGGVENFFLRWLTFITPPLNVWNLSCQIYIKFEMTNAPFPLSPNPYDYDQKKKNN